MVPKCQIAKAASNQQQMLEVLRLQKENVTITLVLRSFAQKLL